MVLLNILGGPKHCQFEHEIRLSVGAFHLSKVAAHFGQFAIINFEANPI